MQIIDGRLFCIQYTRYIQRNVPPTEIGDIWKAYQFKWIENLGTSSQIYTNYDWNTTNSRVYGRIYPLCSERDYNENKRLFNEMIGHVPELYTKLWWKSW